jgi:hypothetical protein
MNKFIVASRIGKTVHELEDTMTAEEFAHWLAFLDILKANS